MNFFMELDLASATWWAKDKIRIAKGYLEVMGTICFCSLCMFSIGAPAITIDSYIFGFIGYIIGYYLDTMTEEIIRLFRKLFKKGVSK